MNILLWVLQGLVALLYFAGGGFKAFNPADVASQIPALPQAAWRVVGAFEVLGAVLLIVPAALHWKPELVPLAAALLALETLALAVLYASYSLKLAPTNPLLFAVPMFLIVVFVAYGRYALSPLV